ncbi:hypothetical protein A9827_18820, partial [Salmonella enterica]|nr:hypothetical protein [Salmonella enterica]
MKIYITINESFKKNLTNGNNKSVFIKISDNLTLLSKGLECDLFFVEGNDYILIKEFTRILIDENSRLYEQAIDQLSHNGTIELSNLLTTKNKNNFFSQVISDNSYYQIKDLLKNNTKKFLLKIRDIGALAEYNGDVKLNEKIFDRLII